MLQIQARRSEYQYMDSKKTVPASTCPAGTGRSTGAGSSDFADRWDDEPTTPEIFSFLAEEAPPARTGTWARFTDSQIRQAFNDDTEEDALARVRRRTEEISTRGG